MSAHILTRSAGASARRRFRTSLSNSGVVSFIEAFLQHVGNTQIGRPTAKIAEVRASRKQRAHVAKLQLRSGLLGPDKFGENQILPGRHPGVEAGDAHAHAPLELVHAEPRFLADDEVELHELFEVKHVEHASVRERPRDVGFRDVVLRLEEGGKPLGIASGALDKEIDVARHARLGIVAEGERAREHICNACALEASESGLQNLKLGAHGAQPAGSPEAFREVSSLLAFRRAVEHPPGPGRRHRPVLVHDLPVDDHVGEAGRVLVRFLERGRVAHARRIEDGDVRLHSGPQHAAVGEPDPRERVNSARFLPASDISHSHSVSTTFLGSPPPRSFRMRSAVTALIFARVAGSLSRASVCFAPPSSAHAGSSAASSRVLEAVYGYWSSVASTPRERASSISLSVSTLLPQLPLPITLWCDTCVGRPPCSPMAIVSLTLSCTLEASSRMCEV